MDRRKPWKIEFEAVTQGVRVTSHEETITLEAVNQMTPNVRIELFGVSRSIEFNDDGSILNLGFKSYDVHAIMKRRFRVTIEEIEVEQELRAGCILCSKPHTGQHQAVDGKFFD